MASEVGGVPSGAKTLFDLLNGTVKWNRLDKSLKLPLNEGRASQGVVAFAMTLCDYLCHPPEKNWTFVRQGKEDHERPHPT